MLTRGRVVEPKEVIEKLAAVDARAVQAVAEELFQPGRIGLGAAGPGLTMEFLTRSAGSLAKL